MTARARILIAAWITGASVLSCDGHDDPTQVPDGGSSQDDAAGGGSGGVGGAAGSSAAGGAAGSSGNGSGGAGASSGSGGAGGNAGSGAAGGNSGSGGAGATGGTAGTGGGSGGVGGDGGLAGSSGSGGVDAGGTGGSNTGGSGGFIDSGGPGDDGTAGADGGPIVCADSGVSSDAGGGPDGATTTVACVTVYDDDKVTYAGTAPLTYACDECTSSTYPTGPNACRNASDCSLLATGKVRELVRNCTLACRSHEPPSGSCAAAAECNTQCVKMATSTTIGAPGLSDDCGKCHTHLMMCQIAFCLSLCAADADAIECIKCAHANGCALQFQRCTGLDPRN